MDNRYLGWANWATWNTQAHGNFESREDVDAFKEMIEEYETSIEENKYLHSMTYFTEINWEEIYNSVVVDNE